jgi:hypothetical protein
MNLISRFFDLLDYTVTRIGETCKILDQYSDPILKAILAISTIVTLIHYLF